VSPVTRRDGDAPPAVMRLREALLAR